MESWTVAIGVSLFWVLMRRGILQRLYDRIAPWDRRDYDATVTRES